MLWLALLRPAAPGQASPPWPEAVAWWALQFTPRVARCEEALLLELAASLRLFKGRAALQQRLLSELSALNGAGQATLAWAPNASAALALARAAAPGEVVDGLSAPLHERLDPLPFPVLSRADAHAPLLARLGCRSLGDLRRLPRAALARRTEPALLQALDAAYGQRQEAHDWCRTPEQFAARRELSERSDDAATLLQQAAPLLQAAHWWLAAQHAGCRALQFGWGYDSLRAQRIGPGGALTLAAPEPHRDAARWQRLLAEHLRQLALEAPVSELWLRIEQAEALPESSARLFQGASGEQGAAEQESLPALLQRLAVRLGPEQVRQAQPQADHRPEAQQRWQPWPHTASVPDTPLPQEPGQWPAPAWLLNPPLPLACLREQPLYQGALTLLAGPQRVESGWWQPEAAVQRDYYLAHNAQAGLVWVYRERGSGPSTVTPHRTWFLHGVMG